MELKYKTQFADLEELSILGLYRRPIQRLSLTIMWIGVPIYIIIFALSKLYTINVQNYFQLISSYKIPVKKEKTLT